MSTISLCMIVKNEAEALPRCLDSVSGLVDEIVIVDTGSGDGTEQLARRYTDKVYSFPWIDDFSAARNFAFERASMDYCMWLDADDVLLEPDREAFQELKRTLLPEADVVMLPYHTAFDEQGRPAFSYYRERILRRGPRCRFQGAVHEAVAPWGKVVYGRAAVTHRKLRPGDPDRNLHIFEGLLARGQTLVPREQFYYARELYYHQRYEDASKVLETFLSQGQGWVENQIDACRVLADCYDALGRRREARRALLESFAFAPPRAETCCALGARFLRDGDFSTAAYWYELALTLPRSDRSGAFVSPDCYGYLPCIQLAVCWYHLGNTEKAREYNDRAGAFKPEDAAYLHNRAFFDSLTEKS